MKRIIICFAAYVAALAVYAQIPVYQDETKPLEERVQDALDRMTLKEKCRLSYAQSKFSSPGCPRLGIPELWMSDGPHGVRMEINWNDWNHSNWTNDSCTAFPALTCLAATWNETLAGEYGKAVGEEARYRGKDVLLGPGVNIFRTPLNGRNFEYLGEDPYLAARMCVPYIKGVQSNGVAACVKHYALNNQETIRDRIDVHVSDRALYEIYLPAFKAAVTEGNVWSIMGAYNKYNGQYATHHKRLNNDILKGEWNFDGAVITDWGAAHDTFEAAMFGLDIEMGSYTNGLTSESEFGYDDYYLGDAYYRMALSGEIPMEVVNDKAARVLRLIFRTAMNRFKPFGSMTSPEHYETARKIASEGIVLLKNDGSRRNPALLPVKDGKYPKILVVGDNATRSLTKGGGSSELKVKDEYSPLYGIRNRFPESEVSYAQGYMAGPPMYGRTEEIPVEKQEELRTEAVAKAREADLVIFVGGLNKNHFQDCEGGDRQSYSLPFCQDELIESLIEANPNTIVVITSGNPVRMPWINDVRCLVQSWYLGTTGGLALADIISGDVNPSGKLPFTYPKELEDCPAHHFGEISYPGDGVRQEYLEDILVGYRWYDTKDVEPLFPFGYGLSYTTFDYGKPALSAKSMSANGTVTVTVEITNSGAVAGKETIQLYVGDDVSSVIRPKKELKRFCKVALAPGETRTVSFELTGEDLKFYDDKAGAWVLEPGRFTVYVAASADDVKGSACFDVIYE